VNSKPSKKVTKAPMLAVNIKKGKILSMKGSNFTITKYLDSSSPK